ncbi:hypothetical protein [Flavobacterium hydatis]|uniref:Lipoprotein n=1 Tax=Flavobacterium hydatis TaxID=991 RepID=A0A086A011_FLAHY|nr:hypothetical protein [Flavobacterium hydatis]KFF10025.1 hypothetical protein IW20_21330 [Flavobacterium hydatis]OXA93343.1 hypothetical protein B0A62_13950 [Flavobacterium hydatis]
MKQKYILFIFLTALLISCKDTVKQENNAIKPDSIKQEEKNTPSVTTDSSTAVYFIKTKMIPATDELKKRITEKIESVESVDFTGDKIPDYICKTAVDSLGIGNEYWISSEYKTIKKAKHYTDGFNYRWFINLDDDPEPEIFETNGDEDGADYTIRDQDLIAGKDKILLYINPFIIENQKKYWGYSWDVKNIIARKNGTNIELFCSLNHKVIRDGNEENDPKSQKIMPVIFFTGHHTQESGNHFIKKEQWLSLKEIIKQTKR